MDQLSFCTPDYSTLHSKSVPLVGGVPNSYVSVGTGIIKASSLMGSFPVPPPEAPHMISMISTISDGSIDLWILPKPSEIDSYGDQMPLSLADLAYKSIQSAFEPSISLVLTNGTTLSPTTVPSKDLLHEVLPTNEAI